MKWLKDGKRIVSAGPDFSVSVSDWTNKSDKPLINRTEHEYKIFSVDVDDEEELMVTAGSGSEIVFWDFKRMTVLKKEKANAWITYNAKFIKGSNLIATGASNGQLRMYDNIGFNVVA